jgi:hypothetical protein
MEKRQGRISREIKFGGQVPVKTELSETGVQKGVEKTQGVVSKGTQPSTHVLSQPRNSALISFICWSSE